MITKPDIVRLELDSRIIMSSKGEGADGTRVPVILAQECH